jgi:hypothetical protein
MAKIFQQLAAAGMPLQGWLCAGTESCRVVAWIADEFQRPEPDGRAGARTTQTIAGTGPLLSPGRVDGSSAPPPRGTLGREAGDDPGAVTLIAPKRQEKDHASYR